MKENAAKASLPFAPSKANWPVPATGRPAGRWPTCRASLDREPAGRLRRCLARPGRGAPRRAQRRLDLPRIDARPALGSPGGLVDLPAPAIRVDTFLDQVVPHLRSGQRRAVCVVRAGRQARARRRLRRREPEDLPEVVALPCLSRPGTAVEGAGRGAAPRHGAVRGHRRSTAPRRPRPCTTRRLSPPPTRPQGLARADDTSGCVSGLMRRTRGRVRSPRPAARSVARAGTWSAGARSPSIRCRPLTCGGMTEPTRRLELLTARLQVGCATSCATPAGPGDCGRESASRQQPRTSRPSLATAGRTPTPAARTPATDTGPRRPTGEGRRGLVRAWQSPADRNLNVS